MSTPVIGPLAVIARGVAAVVALVVMSGCGGSSDSVSRAPASTEGVPNESRGALTAFVSIPTQAGLLERIVGDRVRVEVLAPPGQDPHTFDVPPRRLAELIRADAYFAIGVEFEERVLAGLKEAGRPRVFAANQSVPVLFGAHSCDHGHGENSHDHDHSAAPDSHDHLSHGHAGRADPHIWMCPRRARQIALNMCDGLVEIDPAGREAYIAATTALIAELNQLDARITERLAAFRGRSFVVFHPAYTYFADTYGLEQIAIEYDGKEPRGQWLTDAVRRLREGPTRVIFYQPQFDRLAATTLAEAIGGRAVPWDSLPHDLMSEWGRMTDDLVAAFGESR